MLDRLISRRSQSINGSGIRRVFEIGAGIPEKVDLSIGQPDFPVPDAIKRAAIDAIQNNRNGYPLTRGVPELRESVTRRLRDDVGWEVGAPGNGPGLLITSGTSGGLMLACLALLDPGDEIVIPDPYFVLYTHLPEIAHAKPVLCPIYPDFRMTAERVEPLITARTKAVLLNSPSNPPGVVLTERECADLLDLCRRRGIVLISDEIYDQFTFSEARTQAPARGGGPCLCPSPARFKGAEEHVLLVRGFGKTYGVTGWRLGYAAGPRWLLEEMTKLQQYVYVSSPHPLQVGVAEAFSVDMSAHIAEYERRRDMVVSRLSAYTEVTPPGGAFYAFVRVPPRLGWSDEEAGEKFFRACVDRRVLIVPGRTFSTRDTHFRLSFAAAPDKLERGLDVICDVMKG